MRQFEAQVAVPAARLAQVAQLQSPSRSTRSTCCWARGRRPIPRGGTLAAAARAVRGAGLRIRPPCSRGGPTSRRRSARTRRPPRASGSPTRRACRSSPSPRRGAPRRRRSAACSRARTGCTSCWAASRSPSSPAAGWWTRRGPRAPGRSRRGRSTSRRCWSRWRGGRRAGGVRAARDEAAAEADAGHGAAARPGAGAAALQHGRVELSRGARRGAEPVRRGAGGQPGPAAAAHRRGAALQGAGRWAAPADCTARRSRAESVSPARRRPGPGAERRRGGRAASPAARSAGQSRAVAACLASSWTMRADRRRRNGRIDAYRRLRLIVQDLGDERDRRPGVEAAAGPSGTRRAPRPPRTDRSAPSTVLRPAAARATCRPASPPPCPPGSAPCVCSTRRAMPKSITFSTPSRVEQQVLRLDVAVDHALAVRDVSASASCGADGERRRHAEPAARVEQLAARVMPSTNSIVT